MANCSDPIATKEIGEPKCQNDLPPGDWCITSNTPIWINVTDDGTEPCIVGAVNLYYRIWYDGEWKEYQAYATSGTLSELIYLEGECMHYLEFLVEFPVEYEVNNNIHNYADFPYCLFCHKDPKGRFVLTGKLGKKIIFFVLKFYQVFWI